MITPSTSSGRAASTRVVGGIDGLREVAPAGQRRDAVFAEELDGGQHVRAGRQQPAVTEGTEDAGVVGGGRTQVEQVPFGGRDGVVEEFAQLVGEAVEFLGVRVPSPTVRGPGRRRPPRCGGPGTLRACRRRRARQAQQLREPLLGGQRLGEAPLGLVGPLGRGRRVRRAGRGQLRAGLRRGRFAGLLGGLAGGLARRVPGGHGGLLGVAGGERGPRRVGVRCAVVQPAGADGLGGLLLDLGEPLAQVPGLAAGALRLGRGGGGVAVGGVADLLERGGPLLLLVGEGSRRSRRRRAGRVRGPRRPWRGRRARGPRPVRPPGWRRTRARRGRRRRGGAARPRRPARRSAGCGRRPARASARRRTSRRRPAPARRAGRRVRRRRGNCARGRPPSA